MERSGSTLPVLILILAFLFFRINAQSLNYGDTQIASLAIAGETDTFSFAGQPGDLIYARLASNRPGFDAQLELLGPQGNRITLEWTDNGPTTVRAELLAAGEYMLIVSDRSGINANAEYGITLHQFNSPSYATAIGYNTVANGTISQLSQANLYEVNIGQEITSLILLAAKAPSALQGRLEVYSADGTLAAIVSRQEGESATRLDSVFTQGGKYYLLVMDEEGNFSSSFNGGYGLALYQKFENPDAIQLGENETIVGSIEALAEAGFYSFNARGGERILLRSSPGTTSLQLHLEVYSPQGALLWAGRPVSGSNRTVRLDTTLTETGQYTVLIMDREGNQDFAGIGDYGLTILRKLNPNASQHLSLNSTTTHSVTQLSEVDQFSFDWNAEAGVILRFGTKNIGLNPEVELYDPQGGLIWKNRTGSIFNDMELRLDTILTETGSYTLLFMDFNGDFNLANAGDYGITILEKGNNPNAAFLGIDETASGLMSRFAQIDEYTLSALPGEPVILRIGSQTGSFNPQAELYAADGRLIWSGFNTDVSHNELRLDTTLDETGILRLLVMDYAGNFASESVGNYGITYLKKFGSSLAASLPVDTTLAGIIDKYAQIRPFTFDVDSENKFLLRAASDFSVQPKIEVYGPDQQLIRSLESPSTAETVARLDTTLTQPGTYTLLLMDKKGTLSGGNPFDFGVTLLNKFNSTKAVTLSPGQISEQRLGQISEVDVFTFSTEDPDSLALSIIYDFPISGMAAEIYGPNRQVIYSFTADNLARTQLLYLDEPGSYTVLVFAENGRSMGDYRILLEKLEAQPVPFGEWFPFEISDGTSFRGIVNVPEVDDLFYLVKKSNRVDAFRSWRGQATIFPTGRQEEALVDEGKYTVFSLGGNADYDFHLRNPDADSYNLEVQTQEGTGTGWLLITDSLNRLELGRWSTGEILRPYGFDWWVFDLPPDVDTLYIRSEGFGQESSIEIFHEFLENPDDKWILGNTYIGNYSIAGTIPNPPAGRYFLRYKDSAVLTSGSIGNAQGTGQRRDYLIFVDASPPQTIESLELRITGLSAYEAGGGPATIEVKGTGFSQTDTVKLVKDGQVAARGFPTLTDSTGRSLKVLLELDTVSEGEYDFTVCTASGDTAVAPAPFVVADEASPVEDRVWVEIIGRENIRVGRRQSVIIRYGNRGNTDLYGAVLYLDDHSGIIEEMILPDSTYTRDSYNFGNTTLFLIPFLPAHASDEFEIVLKVNFQNIEDQYRLSCGFIHQPGGWEINESYTTNSPPSLHAPQWRNNAPNTPQPGDMVIHHFDLCGGGNPVSPGHNGIVVEYEIDGMKVLFVSELLSDGYFHQRIWEAPDSWRMEFDETFVDDHLITEEEVAKWQERGIDIADYIDCGSAPCEVGSQVTDPQRGLVDWKDLNDVGDVDFHIGEYTPPQYRDNPDLRDIVQDIAKDRYNNHNRMEGPDGKYFDYCNVSVGGACVVPEAKLGGEDPPFGHSGTATWEILQEGGVINIDHQPYFLPKDAPNIIQQQYIKEQAPILLDITGSGSPAVLLRSPEGPCEDFLDAILNLLILNRIVEQSRNFAPILSITPEDKSGPTGFDRKGAALEDQRRFLDIPPPTFGYRIDYWNREDATAPAAEVFIRDTLDPALALNTLNFTGFGFLRWEVPIDGGQYFNVNVDLRPDFDLIVNVEATIDPATREIYWVHRSLDPETLELPEDPMAGYLPPIDSTGYQIGWVSFTVTPTENLPSETAVSNQAFVNFDGIGPWGPAPPYGPYRNTYDFDAPTSQVLALEPEVDPEFTVSWEGSDGNGSGISHYSIFVSADMGPYELWLSDTIALSATFEGEPGGSYRFYSVATDFLGHVEPAPSVEDAATTVKVVTNNTAVPLDKGFHLFQNVPNPVSGPTRIRFTLPTRIQVRLEVLNNLGQSTLLINQEMPAGTHAVEWRPDNLADGLYYYRMKAGPFQETKKMIYLNNRY